MARPRGGGITRADVQPPPAEVVTGQEVAGDEEAEIRPPEEMPEGWQNAYTRAISKGNTEKAARLFADQHERDFEPKDPDDPEEEIKRLEARIEQLKGAND